MKRPAKKRVVTPRTRIVPDTAAIASKLPVEPGSLFDMEPTSSEQSGSIETFAADKVSDAISEPLRDMSGEHRVAQSFGSDQRSADQDEKKRFADPSRVIEATELADDAFTQDDSSATSLFGTVTADDDDDDSSNGVS